MKGSEGMSMLNPVLDALRNMRLEAVRIQEKLIEATHNIDNLLSRESEKGLIQAQKIVGEEINAIDRRLLEIEDIEQAKMEIAYAEWEVKECSK